MEEINLKHNNVLLTAREINKDFGGIHALDQICFSLSCGEIHAICGENGAGKSTFIKILSGVYPYGTYEGEVVFQNEIQRFSDVGDSERKGIVAIYQELALVMEMSIAENIFLGNEISPLGFINEEEMIHRSERLLKELGVSLDARTKIKDLGVGFQQMVAIAKALSKNTRILILDEPTAALTDEETECLFKLLLELKNKKVSIIYISHKLEEVFKIADRITVLRDGKAIQTLNLEETTEKKIVSLMVGREITQRFPKETHGIGEVLFEVQNFTVCDKFNPEKKLVERINLKVRKGEVLGISGLMGAGRTELAMAIFGIHPGKVEGKVFIREKELQIRYPGDAIANGLWVVTEDRRRYGLVMSQSIRHNLSLSALSNFLSGILIDDDKESKSCGEISSWLKIKMQSLENLVENLSGGNQQKVVLGKGLMCEPEVLILDEPTRGIDVGAKYEIYKLINYLTAQGKAIIMISSELPEILGMSDRIIVMCEGKITGEFDRNNASQEAIMHCATGYLG